MRENVRRLAPLGLALVLAAAAPCLIAWGQGRPPRPDVIVGDIQDVRIWGSQGNFTAYSFGTTSCNIGQRPLDWLPDPDPRHPVIAQNLYRVKDGRIEQIALSWLKHGFSVAAGRLCGNCQDFSTNRLGVNCSDPYSAFLNGSQGNLGPRSEVNAATGVFRTPFSHLPGSPGVLGGRLRVRQADVDPVLNPGATYLIEAQYVHPQDAAAGNGANNASYRPLRIDASTGNPVLRIDPAAPTQRTQPAIAGWAGIGPGTAQLFNVDVPGDGRMILGVRTVRTATGLHHEIALQNINSDRSASSLQVTMGSGTLSNFGFHAPTYDHEPYSSAPWTVMPAGSSVTWATEPFATNQNANALRWGTLYSFWLDSEQPIQSVTVGLFKPGDPSSIGPIPIPIPPITPVVAQAPPASPVVEGMWLVAPDHVEMSLGKDPGSFRVYAIPGLRPQLAKVSSSSPHVSITQTAIEEGDLTGWEIKLERSPEAPEGHYESIITFESSGKQHDPVVVRSFGEILGRPSE